MEKLERRQTATPATPIWNLPDEGDKPLDGGGGGNPKPQQRMTGFWEDHNRKYNLTKYNFF